MDIELAIRTGFYARLLGATNDFKTAAADKFFWQVAPQVLPGTKTKVEPPYVVMSLLPISPDRDSATKLYSCVAQFNVAAMTSSECGSLAGKLSDRLEDCEPSLSFPGFLTVEIRRQPQISLGQVEQVWNIVVQFSIIIQQ